VNRRLCLPSSTLLLFPRSPCPFGAVPVADLLDTRSRSNLPLHVRYDSYCRRLFFALFVCYVTFVLTLLVYPTPSCTLRSHTYHSGRYPGFTFTICCIYLVVEHLPVITGLFITVVPGNLLPAPPHCPVPVVYLLCVLPLPDAPTDIAVPSLLLLLFHGGSRWTLRCWLVYVTTVVGI